LYGFVLEKSDEKYLVVYENIPKCFWVVFWGQSGLKLL
jgi:hypothetical protein